MMLIDRRCLEYQRRRRRRLSSIRSLVLIYRRVIRYEPSNCYSSVCVLLNWKTRVNTEA